jgi:hypothetical protein
LPEQYPESGVEFWARLNRIYLTDIMGETPNVEALQKTRDALMEIRVSLLPYVKLLKSQESVKKIDRSAADASKLAEAQSVVALAVGTLRYMGARLSGKDQGRHKTDPLRIELDKMRQTLVTLRKLEPPKEKKNSAPQNDGASTKGENTEQQSRGVRRQDGDKETQSSVASKQGNKKKRKSGSNSESLSSSPANSKQVGAGSPSPQKKLKHKRK